jgi:plastocyanin
MKLITRKAVLALAALAVASLGVTACGGATSTAAPAPAAAPAAGDTSSYGTNAITLNVIPHAITMSGVDSAVHDAVLPSSWVVKKGQTFTLTAINYDGGPHTITAPTLGLKFLIAAGKEDPATKKVTPTTSTITFVATKTGAFHWYCSLPCDGPSHLGMEIKGNDGRGYDMIMAGTIVVQA